MLDTIKGITEIIGILAAAVGLPGVILWYLAGRKSREEAQCDSTRLILTGIRKIGQLAYANAVAYIKGEVNGEMEKAMEGYGEYMDELSSHLEKQAARK